jgi:hypothetical protein
MSAGALALLLRRNPPEERGSRHQGGAGREENREGASQDMSQVGRVQMGQALSDRSRWSRPTPPAEGTLPESIAGMAWFRGSRTNVAMASSRAEAVYEDGRRAHRPRSPTWIAERGRHGFRVGGVEIDKEGTRYERTTTVAGRRPTSGTARLSAGELDVTSRADSSSASRRAARHAGFGEAVAKLDLAKLEALRGVPGQPAPVLAKSGDDRQSSSFPAGRLRAARGRPRRSRGWCAVG